MYKYVRGACECVYNKAKLQGRMELIAERKH